MSSLLRRVSYYLDRVRYFRKTRPAFFYYFFILIPGFIVAGAISISPTARKFLFQPKDTQSNISSPVAAATPTTSPLSTPAPSLTPTPVPLSTPSLVVDLRTREESLKQAELRKREQDITEAQPIGTLIKYALYTFWTLTVALFLHLLSTLVLQNWEQLEGTSDPTRDMLRKFHQQALQELQRNSRAGLAVSFLGIAVIFTGIFLGYLGNVPLGVITASSGTVIEAVSFLFHNQTKHIRRRVEVLEDKLHRLALVEGIKDTQSADEAKKLLATANIARQRTRP